MSDSIPRRSAPESVLSLSPAARQLDGRVAVVDIDEDVARTTAAEINAEGGRAIALACDITDRARAERCVASVAEQLGGLDILVHNAGLIYSMTGLLETDDDNFERLMAINIKAPLHLTRAALPWLRASRAPRVIFISSQWGQVPDGHSYAYIVSKAGQLGLMKTLAKEFVGEGILVNAITPGAILTRRVPEQYIAAEEAAIPLGRLVHPEEIAAAVAFLASDEAAFITGQCIPVNGGALLVGI